MEIGEATKKRIDFFHGQRRDKSESALFWLIISFAPKCHEFSDSARKDPCWNILFGVKGLRRETSIYSLDKALDSSLPVCNTK